MVVYSRSNEKKRLNKYPGDKNASAIHGNPWSPVPNIPEGAEHRETGTPAR